MTLQDTLTPRQSRIVSFIGNYHREHGCAPLTKEVSAALGYGSHGMVHKEIAKCVEKGALTWNKRRIRTVRVVKNYPTGAAALWGCARCADPSFFGALIDTAKVHTLTVTPAAATERPTCGMCSTPLERLEWQQRPEGIVERSHEGD